MLRGKGKGERVGGWGDANLTYHITNLVSTMPVQALAQIIDT